jgi:predicted small metal-binding protein
VVLTGWGTLVAIKSVVCRSTGAACDFAVQTDSEEELIQMVKTHAKDRHNQDIDREDVLRLAEASGAKRLV